jgi:hypothetical protein
MGLGMETMIMVALLVYVVTGIVGMAILGWYLKVLGPLMKIMTKQYKDMYSELEEEVEADLQRIK